MTKNFGFMSVTFYLISGQNFTIKIPLENDITNDVAKGIEETLKFINTVICNDQNRSMTKCNLFFENVAVCFPKNENVIATTVEYVKE